jgi:hypothetical protein
LECWGLGYCLPLFFQESAMILDTWATHHLEGITRNAYLRWCNRCNLEVLLMESRLETLRERLNELCVKVNERVKELGEKDIMTYRSDPQIRRLQSTVCDIYRESMNACQTYGEARDVCEAFRDYPECLTQLMLSEELACPAGR